MRLLIVFWLVFWGCIAFERSHRESMAVSDADKFLDLSTRFPSAERFVSCDEIEAANPRDGGRGGWIDHSKLGVLSK